MRYEITNEGLKNGKLASGIDATQTTIPLETVDSSQPVYIDNELISSTGTDYATNSTGCTRQATLGNFPAGAARSYTAGTAPAHDARTGVILISNTTTSNIFHWGSIYNRWRL